MKRFKLLYALLPLSFLIATALFYSVYSAVKAQMIAEINERQLTHAKQAARGIETYVQQYINQLSHLAEHTEVIDLNQRGKKHLQTFYLQNQKQIRGITRLGADGRIIHAVPFNPSLIGVSVKHQKHIQDLLATQKPVVSDVFRAIQGFHAIALYVPVFRGNVFRGGLAVLLSAEDLAKQYLQDIRIGQNGYAWLISQHGIELYCPVPGHIGESVYKTSGAFPTIISMAESMMRGESGQTIYWYDHVRANRTESVKKHAVYHPIHVGNTLWSVVVATPEDEIVSLMVGFRNRLFLILLLVGIVGLVSAYYIATIRAREKDAAAIMRSQVALAESERKLRQILEHTTNVFFTHTPDHLLTYMSPQSARVLDFSLEQQNLDWRTFLTDNPVNHHALESTQRALDTGQAQPPYEAEIRTPTGRIRWVEVNEAPVVENGRVIAMAGSLTDISDRKHLDEERQKGQKLESLGILAGGIAHDFNNLLMSILGSISLAKHYLHGNDQARNQIEQAEKASLRAKDLAQQLLTFSRGGEPVAKSIELGPLLKDTISFSLRGSKSRYELSFAEGLWPVLADAGQISQVINNIVINADQAMPDGGVLTVSVKNVDPAQALADGLPSREHVKISIADKGAGIEPEVLKKIFDPYFTTKAKGSGLGLATAYSIIKNHGGRITVHSTVGHGAQFDIYLPAAQEKPKTPEPQAAGIIRGNGRILVMDDEDDIRAVLLQMLTALGYRPDGCADGDAAVELFGRAQQLGDPYDLVMMDLTVPGGKGGKDTIGLLREIDPGVSAIVSSGYANDPIMAHYEAYGFVGVISKPFNIMTLSEVVASVLAARRTQ